MYATVPMATPGLVKFPSVIVGAEVAVDRARVVLERRQALLQRLDGGTRRPFAQGATGRDVGGGRRAPRRGRSRARARAGRRDRGGPDPRQAVAAFHCTHAIHALLQRNHSCSCIFF